MAKVNDFDGFILVYQIWGHHPCGWYFEKYKDALSALKEHTGIPFRQPYEKAIACIMNHKMEVVYKTEVGPDEK